MLLDYLLSKVLLTVNKIVFFSIIFNDYLFSVLLFIEQRIVNTFEVTLNRSKMTDFIKKL